MIYPILKHSHMMFALLSISFFLIRAYFSFSKPELLKIKAIKIAPHIIDTLLLIMAISLIFVLGVGLHTWIIAKIVALVFYIGFATIVIKQFGSITIRILACVMALLSFSYIVSVAITKQALWFI